MANSSSASAEHDQPDEPDEPDEHDQPIRLTTGSPGVQRPSAACLYILRLTSGMLYVGVTADLKRRWQEHAGGRGSRITSEDPPNGIVHREPFTSIAEAHVRERQLKRWTRAKKEALVARDLARLRYPSRRHKS